MFPGRTERAEGTSNIQRRTSNVEHRTSNVEHRTSNVEHRTSKQQRDDKPNHFVHRAGCPIYGRPEALRHRGSTEGVLPKPMWVGRVAPRAPWAILNHAKLPRFFSACGARSDAP